MKLMIAALLVCLLLQQQARASASQQERREQAVTHFNAGNQAFSEGDTHEAYRQYLTAWALDRAFDIACNLGRSEAELGKLKDAAEHLSYCLDNFSASPQPAVREARQRYRDLFQTISAKVARFSLLVEPDGAELVVDGVSLGKTPLQRDFFVLPGKHRVELRLQGYRDFVRDVPASAGEIRQLSLRLEPLEPAHPQQVLAGSVEEPSGAGQDRESSRFSARHAVLLGGGVLTLAGAGIGIGYYLQGNKLDDEANALRRDLGAGSEPSSAACSAEPADARCAKLADTVQRRDRAWDVAAGGFVAMGAFGLGTLAAWWFWPDPSADEARPRQRDAERLLAMRLQPLLGADQLGAVWSGYW